MFKWFKKAPVVEAPVVPVEPEIKTVTVEVTKPCDCHQELQKLVSDEANLRLEISSLKKEESKARKNLEVAKLDHKITVEDIQHMQKMLDEKNALELDRKTFEAEKACELEIKGIRKEYADKLEKELTVERKKMQEFMERVMDALPNVNVKLKG